MQQFKKALLFIGFVIILLSINIGEVSANYFGYWKKAASMHAPRTVHGVAKINNNILVSGGYLDGQIIKSSEIYDSSSDSWKISQDMNFPRMLFGSPYMINLSDGKILTTNGEGPSFVQGLSKTEIYDPTTDTWSILNDSQLGRYRAIFAPLPNNKVLLTGGNTGSGITSSAEIFDVTSNTWSYTSNMHIGREGTPSLSILNNGKLLITGGFNGSSDEKTAEIFDPLSETWELTHLPFSINNGNTITLNNGKVLAISINGAAILNPETKVWGPAKNMTTARRSVGSFLLSDGEVLAYGGSNDNGTLSSVEIYNPNTDEWLEGPSLPKPLESISPLKINKYTHIIEGGGNSDGVLSDTYLFIEPFPNKNLDVPHIRQTNPLWYNKIYDSANIWNPSDPTINSWGCALTSAVMILNYHGITKLPDKTIINPLTLNDWLKTQKDGYIANGLVNWLAISRLSKQAKNVNKITKFDALEFSKKKSNNLNTVKEDITNNIPDILEIPGHFLVARGIIDDDIKINDPFYPKNLLSQYSNNLISINTFKPSFTDLSYIMIVANSNTNVELQNENGDKLSEAILENSLQSDNNISLNNNSNIKILYYPKPAENNYKVKITSVNQSSYELKILLYDEQGNVMQSTNKGTLQTDGNKIIPINFLNHKDFYSKKESLNSLSKDVTTGLAKKQIKSLILSLEIDKLITKARIEESLKKKSDELSTLNKLEELITSNKDKIAEPAYSKILYDINYQQTHL